MVDTPTLMADVVVKTGSFSPICTRAFSRLRARMVGLASRLVAPASPRKVASSAGLATLARKLARSPSDTWPLTPGRPYCTVSGQPRPSSSSRLLATSITSTAIITSGSARSSVAINCSTWRTTSAVSRTTSAFSRSSAYRSRVLVIVRTRPSNCRASALTRYRLRVTSSWCSRCLAAVLG